MKKPERLTYAIDIDGTLTKTVWFPGDPEPEPMLDRIAKVNEMYNKRHTIFLWTARKEENRPETEMWLAKHRVRYNALVMNKLAVDRYIDDKGTNADEYFRDENK